jgi:hypothetical protein
VVLGDELVHAARKLVAEHGAKELELQVDGQRIALAFGDDGVILKSRINFPGRFSAQVPAVALFVAAQYAVAKTKGTWLLPELRSDGEWLYVGAGGTSYPLTKFV